MATYSSILAWRIPWTEEPGGLPSIGSQRVRHNWSDLEAAAEEELKNKHAQTNNTITEVKNTLEGINSRKPEAEEWISELEDKMLEITSEEQSKVKRMKRTEDTLRDLWDSYQVYQHSNSRGPRSQREKERVWENFWRDYSWKFPQQWEGNSQSSPRGAKSPIQDKPKEKHAKIHTNQTNKD